MKVRAAKKTIYISLVVAVYLMANLISAWKLSKINLDKISVEKLQGIPRQLLSKNYVDITIKSQEVELCSKNTFNYSTIAII